MAIQHFQRVSHRRLFYEPIQAEIGSSFFYKSFGPHQNTGLKWHHHPEIEIALVTKGCGKRHVGDSIEAFSEGDLVLLGSDLPHTWCTDSADGLLSSKVIQFLPTVFDGLLHHTTELKPIATMLHRADRGLRLRGNTRDECERLFRHIVDADSPSWRQVADLITMLGTIADSRDVVELSTAVPRAPTDEQTGRKVDRVFALLHRPPNEIPSQAIAAHTLKMSPAAFSRFFRNAVGKTYVACVNEIRILATCRDLIETDRSIIDIAYAAGFENLSNFNRRFRALRQTTPRVFRAQHR